MTAFDVSLSLGSNTASGDLVDADTKFTPFLENNLQVSSLNQGDHINPLFDSISVDDTILSTEINNILERLSLASTVLTTGNYHGVIQEAIEQSDLVKGIITLVIQEQLTIDDIVSNYQLYKNIVTEICNINDITFNTGVFHIALSVALTLSDLVSHLNEIISENITISEDLLEILFLFNTILEDVNLDDNLQNTLNIFNIVVENASLDDSQANSATLHNSIQEDISFMIGMNIDGINYEGWLLNPENFAVWNYNNFNFNSVTAFGETYLMANENGLYELGGDFDNGEIIISKIKTASLDFGTSSLKQISDMILGVDNSGRLILKVSTDGDQTSYYELKPGSRNYQNQRIKIGKGLYGRYWQFELITKDNSTFDLDTLEVLPFIFKRKLR